MQKAWKERMEPNLEQLKTAIKEGSKNNNHLFHFSIVMSQFFGLSDGLTLPKVPLTIPKIALYFYEVEM